MKSIKALLLVIVLFTFSTFSFAEGDNSEAAKKTVIKGTVVDKATGETLAGVTVYVLGTDLKATTDLDGNFIITDIKSGDYKIKASFISYRDEIKNLSLPVIESEVKVELESR